MPLQIIGAVSTWMKQGVYKSWTDSGDQLWIWLTNTQGEIRLSYSTSSAHVFDPLGKYNKDPNTRWTNQDLIDISAYNAGLKSLSSLTPAGQEIVRRFYSVRDEAPEQKEIINPPVPNDLEDMPSFNWGEAGESGGEAVGSAFPALAVALLVAGVVMFS